MNDKKLKISLVMATYNGEKYIKKQLESIRKQTQPIDEVIISDDNSNDTTMKIVKNYILNYNLHNWYVYSNDENIGYKKNFYRAIKKATGDIIFLADQDDEWYDFKVKTMVKKMIMNPQIMALNSSLQLIDEKSNQIKIRLDKNYYNSNFLYLEHAPMEVEVFGIDYIGLHNISPGCTMAFRKEIASLFLELYDYKLPHDWFINMIASATNGCFYLNEKLMGYRQHGNNTIGANTSVISGILTKTRSERIYDYMSRNNSLIEIAEQRNILFSDKLRQVITLNNLMVKFYKNPNLIKLFKLRFNPLYYQLAKRKVRLWEFVTSLKLDEIIVRWIKRKEKK